jgi:hypothetical protein
VEPRAIWSGIFEFKGGRCICKNFLPRLLRGREGGQVRKEGAPNGVVDGKLPQYAQRTALITGFKPETGEGCARFFDASNLAPVCVRETTP